MAKQVKITINVELDDNQQVTGYRAIVKLGKIKKKRCYSDTLEGVAVKALELLGTAFDQTFFLRKIKQAIGKQGQ